MKKSKQSNDIFDILDKQYKAMLLIVKLTASVAAEIKDLSSAVQEQNALLKQIVSSFPLEEEPV
jgi:hypothetical protein